MAAEKIAAKSIKTDRTAEIEKDLGADLNEAVALFGEKAVYDLYHSQATIRVQAVMRSVLDNADNGIDVAVAEGTNWAPGVKRAGGPRIDPMDALVQKIARGELTVDDVRKQLREKLAAAEEAAKAAPSA